MFHNLPTRPVLARLLGMLLFTAGEVGADPIFSLRLFNTDDTLRAYISNATYTHTPILTNGFMADTGLQDISSYLRPGSNRLELELQNLTSGYTYGYELRRDSAIIDSATCGQVGVAGCNSNDVQTGIVFEHSVTFGTTPLTAPDSLHLFNTDDTLTAYVTNSAYSGQLILTNGFLQDSGAVDVSSYVRPGDNRFDLFLTNSFAGYTWGYEFKDGATVIDQDSCGTVNTVGCHANNLARGTVFSHTLLVQGPAAVPEPGSLLLLGAGLVAIVARRARQRSRSF